MLNKCTTDGINTIQRKFLPPFLIKLLIKKLAVGDLWVRADNNRATLSNNFTTCLFHHPKLYLQQAQAKEWKKRSRKIPLGALRSCLRWWWGEHLASTMNLLCQVFLVFIFCILLSLKVALHLRSDHKPHTTIGNLKI